MELLELTSRMEIVEETLAKFAETVQEFGRFVQQNSRDMQIEHKKKDLQIQAIYRRVEAIEAETAAIKAQTAEDRIRGDNLIAEIRAETDAFEAKMDKRLAQLEKEHLEFRREMARITASQGRMIEDLVLPSTDTLLRDLVGCTEIPLFEGIRVRKPYQNQRKEYDLVVICSDYILIAESKLTLQPEYVATFLEHLQLSRAIFSDYPNKQIIGALVSLYIDPSLVKHGERQGIIMLGVGDGIMQILNSPGFTPATFPTGVPDTSAI